MRAGRGRARAAARPWWKWVIDCLCGLFGCAARAAVGDERGDGAVGVDKVLVGDALNVGGGDGVDQLLLLVDVLPVAEEEVGGADLLGAVGDGAERAVVGGDELVTGFAELVLGDGGGLEGVELGVDGLFDGCGFDAGAGLGVEDEEAGIEGRADVGCDGKGELLIDEGAVEARALAAAEDGVGDEEWIEVGVAGVDDVVADEQERELGELVDADAALALLRELFGADGWRWRMGGDGRKVLVGEVEDVGGLDLADNDDGGVGRGVGHGVVGFEVVDGPAFDIGGPADDGPVVGRAHEGGGVEVLMEEPEVAVVDAETALGVDDLALAVDDVGEEGEVLDAVGLEIEDELEGGGGGPVLVDGVVGRGVGVVVAAGVIECGVELALAVLEGAIEHHVFEEV